LKHTALLLAAALSPLGCPPGQILASPCSLRRNRSAALSSLSRQARFPSFRSPSWRVACALCARCLRLAPGQPGLPQGRAGTANQRRGCSLCRCRSRANSRPAGTRSAPHARLPQYPTLSRACPAHFPSCPRRSSCPAGRALAADSPIHAACFVPNREVPSCGTYHLRHNHHHLLSPSLHYYRYYPSSLSPTLTVLK